jgi:hypothetical protein
LLAVAPIFFPDSAGAPLRPDLRGIGSRNRYVEQSYMDDNGDADLRELAAGTMDGVNVGPFEGVQVIRFHVWQDLTAGMGEEAAPLYATVTFEMTSDWYQNMSNSCGTIRIEGVKSDAVIQARLVLNQAHYGLGLTQPGSRQLQFVMSPTPMHIKLGPNESMRGVVRMRFGDRQLVVRLPETKVIFTR